MGIPDLVLQGHGRPLVPWGTASLGTPRRRAYCKLLVDLDPGALYIREAIKRGRQVSDYINEQIARLEARVNTLVNTCDRLREENRMLQKSQESLNAEKATLLERNEMARSRIEAMISRLKQMEHG
jgi:cell division protein ZapB